MGLMQMPTRRIQVSEVRPLATDAGLRVSVCSRPRAMSWPRTWTRQAVDFIEEIASRPPRPRFSSRTRACPRLGACVRMRRGAHTRTRAQNVDVLDGFKE